MKCLTIDQPFASLIALGRKRVENRNHDRFRNHRGLLLIHAGVTKRRVTESGPRAAVCRNFSPELYGLDPNTLPFGAIVGAVDVVEHFQIKYLTEDVGGGYQRFRGSEIPAVVCPKFPWLKDHEHVEGPFCLVFENIRRFREPIHCKGLQGMWNLPAELEAKVKESLESAEVLP